MSMHQLERNRWSSRARGRRKLAGPSQYTLNLNPGPLGGDLHLEWAVQRDGDVAAVRYAAFVVGRSGSDASATRGTRGSADDGGLGALAEDLACDGADDGAADDFLHVL